MTVNLLPPTKRLARRCLSALLAAAALLAPLLGAELHAQQVATHDLPPVIPRESLFARAERRAEQLAMATPSTAGPNYIPYPEQIRPLDVVPRVYLDAQDRVITQPVPPVMNPRSFQGIVYRNTSLIAFSAGNMNDSTFAFEGTFASPWLLAGAPPLATPFFTAHILQGPYAPDMPPQLYDAGVEFRWLKQVNERLGVDLTVAPAVFSDFNNSQSRAFRVVGRAVGMWNFTPRLQAALGAVYLGRYDIPVLPVAGFVWTPNDDILIEAIFPRPRLARRFIPSNLVERISYSPIGPLLGFVPEQEHWAYILGELGGNTYAIRRASGLDDMVTYSDLRVVLGWERRIERGVSSRSELGYVFDRSLNYASDPGRIYLTDGFMFRSEVAF